MKWLCILLAFAASCGVTRGQFALDRATVYADTEILNKHVIRKMISGPQGFVWIATDLNLFKFDGSILHKIKDGDFEDIDVDLERQKIIFTSRRNWYQYDYLRDTWEVIDWEGLTTGKYTMGCTTIARDSTYWVGSEHGLTQLRGSDTIRTIPLLNEDSSRISVRDMLQDPNQSGRLWLATKMGMVRYDIETGEQLSYWFKHSDPNIEVATNSYDCLYLHEDGLIYAGSWGGGVVIFDPVSETYHDTLCHRLNSMFAEAKVGLLPHVYAIIPAEEGAIWISSTFGSIRYQPNTRQATIFNSPIRNHPHDQTGPVLIDSDGRYWIGYSKGLRVVDPLQMQFELVTCPMMGDDRWYIPRKILADDTSLLYFCVDHSDGLYTYRPSDRDWHVYKPVDPATPDLFRAWDIISSRDTIWVLGAHVIYTYNRGDSTLSTYPFNYQGSPYKFRSFCRDEHGRFWIGSYTGLYLADPRTGVLAKASDTDTSRYSNDLQYVRNIFKDRNNHLWMTWRDQVLVRDLASGWYLDLTQKFGALRQFFDMYTIYEDDNWLWFGSDNGIFRGQWTGDQFEVELVSNRHTYRLTTEASGQLWTVSGDGLYKIDLADDAAIRFSPADGLPSPGPEGFEDIQILPDNTLVLSARKRYAMIDLDALQPHSEVPVPYLSTLEVNGILIEPDSSLMLKKEIRLDPYMNTLAFQFSAIAYSAPEAIRYRYRLAGVDPDWRYSNQKSNNPSYAHLDPGMYSFKLQAAGHNGAWSESTSLSLIIATPILQQTWLQLLIGGGFLGLLFWLYRRHLQRVTRQHEVRKQISNLEKQALQAQMNPHFVFNAINSIQHLIANGELKKSMLYLNKFSKLLRSVLATSASNRIDLSTELEMLENYILLESLRFEGEFTYNMQVDASLAFESIKVPGFVLQPIVENAIHHGLLNKDGQGHLTIQLTDAGEYIACVIEDNGVGRREAKRRQLKMRNSVNGYASRGLQITQSRLELLYGKQDDLLKTIDLVGTEGQPRGTRVEIKLPVL